MISSLYSTFIKIKQSFKQTNLLVFQQPRSELNATRNTYNVNVPRVTHSVTPLAHCLLFIQTFIELQQWSNTISLRNQWLIYPTSN